MKKAVEFTLSQLSDLNGAFGYARGRNGSKWSTKKLEKLCKAQFLGEILDVIDGRSQIVPVYTPIISRFIRTINIPAITEKFIVRDHFKNGWSEEIKENIRYDERFEWWFLQKIEDPTDKNRLSYHKILKDGHHSDKQLRRNSKSEITLGQIFALMKLHGEGRDTPLLKSKTGSPEYNIFFVRNVENRLFYIKLLGYGSCWDIRGETSISHDCEGYRVFTRSQRQTSKIAA